MVSLILRLVAVVLVVPTGMYAVGSRLALSPTEALTRFQIEPGLRIELVAAEQLVVSAVAFSLVNSRKLYVV